MPKEIEDFPHKMFWFTCSSKRTMTSRSSTYRLMQPALIVFAVLAPIMCSAAPFTARIEAAGSQLAVNGVVAIDVPGSLGAVRAANAASALLKSGAREVVKIHAAPNIWQLTTPGGTVILSIYPADAAAEHTLISDLAAEWAGRLDSLLSLPAVQLPPLQSPLLLPTGTVQALQIGGAADAGQIVVSSDDASVVSASFDPVTRLMTLRSKEPGTSTVAVTASNATGATSETALSVTVENYAGTIASDVNAIVTGAPSAPVDVITQAARTAVCRAVTLDPRCNLAGGIRAECHDGASAGGRYDSVCYCANIRHRVDRRAEDSYCAYSQRSVLCSCPCRVAVLLEQS